MSRVKGILPALRSEHKPGPKLPGSQREKKRKEKEKQDMYTVIDVGLTEKARYQDLFNWEESAPRKGFQIPQRAPKCSGH